MLCAFTRKPHRHKGQPSQGNAEEKESERKEERKKVRELTHATNAMKI